MNEGYGTAFWFLKIFQKIKKGWFNGRLKMKLFSKRKNKIYKMKKWKYIPPVPVVPEGFAPKHVDIESMVDNVNHPSHYETGNFECIDVMIETQGKEAVMDFCVCNAFKYIYRHNNKNGIEDVKKAKWYLDKYIELAEK